MKTTFSKHHFSRAAAILIFAVIAILTAAFWSYTQDDVYITYTFSRNIAEGVGFVFNPGEQVQGTTTPLYALLMAATNKLNTDLLHVGNLLSALFLIAGLMLANRFLRPVLSSYSRIAAVLTIAVSPLIYVSFGMETLFYFALLMQAFALWGDGRLNYAAVAAALLTWTRPDGVVLAAALFLSAMWQDRARRPIWRIIPWRAILIYALVILPWFAFAWLYFGSPLPNTFSAKQEFLRGLKFWQSGWGWWTSFYGNNPLTLIGIPLAVIGAWCALLNARLRPLPIWVVLYTLGYTALNVNAFWYFTALTACLILLSAIGGEWLARAVLAKTGRRSAILTTSTMLIAITSVSAFVRALDFGPQPERVGTYILTGEWIRANTPIESSVVVADLGIAGYYAQRRMIDSFGLIVPDMYQHEPEYAVAKYKADYVLGTQYFFFKRFAEAAWFRDWYVPGVQISTPRDPFSPMTVYRRRWPLEAPAVIGQGLPLPLTCQVDLAKGESIPTETRVQIIGANNAIALETAQPFLRGQYPSDKALGKEHLIEQIAPTLDLAPGQYSWRLMCGAVTREGKVEIKALADLRGYLKIADAAWSGFGQLRGAMLMDSAEVWSGGTVALVLAWEAQGEIAPEYSVFVHLIAADGRVLAQADGQPVGAWKIGQAHPDMRQIELPPTLPEGEYKIAIGWYNWQTNERKMLGNGRDSLMLPITIRNRWPGGSGTP